MVKNSSAGCAIKDQRIIFDGVVVEVDELVRRLKAVANNAPETLVIIKADAKATHGAVVEVMDAAKRSGLNRLAIATKPKERRGVGE